MILWIVREERKRERHGLPVRGVSEKEQEEEVEDEIECLDRGVCIVCVSREGY